MPSVADLKAFLSDPASFPHAPEGVRLVQTHISLVALAGDRVYKVKKPVDFGFLDFSTLARRRHYAEAEIRLNRRLCPGIYRGVADIVQTPDGMLAFADPEAKGTGDGPEGEVADVAVVMDRLDEDAFLHRRLARGAVTPADLDRLCDTLAAFYAEADASAAVAEEGWPERIRVSLDENTEQARPFVGEAITGPAFRALAYYNDRFLDQQAALLHRRRAGGHVVNGHGDLRLEHVHLTDAGVCVYDCIEFNERFRHLDVASDVAFLAMELDVAGHRDAARHVLSGMAERLHDDGILKLADFYRSYRAFVRGKVNALRASEDEVDQDDREASRRRARRLFRWALRYAVAGARPLVVVVMGRSGTGKSTQARALADALGFEAVSSDRVRKQQAGLPPTERPDAATRARLYTPARTEAVYAALRERAVARAAEGEGIILDATYSARAERDALRHALAEANVPHVMVELTAPEDALEDRLAARDAEGDDVVSDARASDLPMLLARYEAPDALEDARHVRIPTTEADPDATTEAVLRALVRMTDG